MKVTKTILIFTILACILIIGQGNAEQTSELNDIKVNNLNLDIPTQSNIKLDNPEFTNKTSDNKIPVIIVYKNNRGQLQAQSDRNKLIHDKGGKVKHEFSIINGVAAELPENAIEAISKNKDVLYIQPDIEVFAHDQEITWGVQKVNALAVHTSTKGAGVKIAILDSGIDYTHPDLDDNYQGGFDFVNYDNDPMDDYGHGTKVAGIIAAEDNNFGILGVAPEASIYGVKVLSSGGSGSTSNVIRGIEWAVENDMDIISMSLGGTSGYYAYETAINNAYNSGVLLIASAGNYGSTATDNVAYPAKYNSVIAVSAIYENNNLCSFSSVGPAVELTAPGYRLKTTAIGGNYNFFSGTSAAAPFVSGVAALTMAQNPTLTNVEIRQKLLQNVVDLGTSGRDNKFGYGIPTLIIETFPMNVDITSESNSIESGQNVEITIHVDSTGNPISDAQVTMSTSDGTFNSISGFTNSNGDFITTYTAPQVDYPSTVTISTTVNKNGYSSDSDSTTISIIPSNPNTYLAESPHPYANSYDNTWEITEPGVTQISIHFSRLETAGQFDYVYIYDMNDIQIARYNGNRNDIWTPWVEGDTIKVRLKSDSAVDGFGFIVDKMVTGSIMPRLETTINANSATLESGQSSQVTVHVSSGGKSISNADVEISTSIGVLSPTIGTTDINGDFIATYSAPQAASKTSAIILVTADKAGYVEASDSCNININPVSGTILVESKHPYSNYYYKTWTITEPGAKQIRVHFPRLETQTGKDYVYIMNKYNMRITQYDGSHNDLWTPWVKGETIKIKLITDGSLTDFGFIIDQKDTGSKIPQLETTITKDSETLESGQNTQIKVQVSSNGNPVSGAAVDISTSDGKINPLKGTTNNNGEFISTYTAPDVTSQTTVTLSATSAKIGYNSESDSCTIKVNPSSTTIPQLETSITTELETLEPGQKTQVITHVSSNGNPVSGAFVSISTSEGNLAQVTGTTDNNGDHITTFTAPEVTSKTTVTISAAATMTGYNSDSGSKTIIVNPLTNTILAESRHPYPNYYYKTLTISEPGASQIRVHFTRIDTQAGHDFVYILNKNRMRVTRYDGSHNDVWTPWVNGDTINVKIITDGAESDFGFIVDRKEIKN